MPHTVNKISYIEPLTSRGVIPVLVSLELLQYGYKTGSKTQNRNGFVFA